MIGVTQPDNLIEKSFTERRAPGSVTRARIVVARDRNRNLLSGASNLEQITGTHCPTDFAHKRSDLRMLEKIIVKGQSDNQCLEGVSRPLAKRESVLEAEQWALQRSADVTSVDED